MTVYKRFKKKNLIKIPENIKVVYCDKKNIVVFQGSFQTKALKLNVKLFLPNNLNVIVVTNVSAFKHSTTNSKNMKKLQGTVTAKIRQMLIETTFTLCQKLNLVGVGYRVFPHEIAERHIYFKLGYSHLIYFKVPKELNSFSQKFVKLFLFGSCSVELLSQTAAQIRACRKPEPYKGKGVLYDQEKITLKKGKKI